MNLCPYKFHMLSLTLFLPFTANVVCSVVCLCILVAYIANNMNPDQTAPLGAVWSGCIVFASKVKLILKCISIYAADVIIGRRHF